MIHPTQKEVHFQLQCIEQRVDHRIERFDDKLDAGMAKLDEISLLFTQTARVFHEDCKTYRYWSAGAVLSILFGVASISAAMYSNGMASFEAGKNTAQQLLDARHQSEKNAGLLRELKQQLAEESSSPARGRVAADQH